MTLIKILPRRMKILTLNRLNIQQNKNIFSSVYIVVLKIILYNVVQLDVILLYVVAPFLVMFNIV
jgi:hypothetical protein